MTRHATLCIAAAAVLLLLPFAAAQGLTVITATLNGKNQMPPINTTADGSFKIDQGPTGNLTFSLVLTGVQNMTMAHIHAGGATASGPVVVTLVPLPTDAATGGQLTKPISATPGTPLRITGAISPANFTGTLAGKTAAEFVTEMATGDYYVNVHTTDEPGGLIRGQTAPSVANGTMPGTGGAGGMMSPPKMNTSPGAGVAPTPYGGSSTPASSAPAFQVGLAAVAAVALAALL